MSVRYTIIDKIATIRVCCTKILPAVYGESLSYMEQIAKLAYKVNETITAVNGLNDNVDALNDAVIEFNERLSNVEGEIEGFEEAVNQRFNELETRVNANVDAKLDEVDKTIDEVKTEQSRFEADVNNRINNLEQTLTTIISDELAYLNQRYASLAEDLRKYVEEKVEEAISDIPDLTTIYVIDPTTGTLAKVQDAINNMFYFELNEALTIDEYNRLQLTIDELNDLMVNSIPRGFTIKEWLTKAKDLLVKQLDIARVDFLAYPHSAVWDYLAGKKVWHDRNVDINQMLIQIAGGYNCGELNSLNITMKDIEDAEITCINYVLNANSVL